MPIPLYRPLLVFLLVLVGCADDEPVTAPVTAESSLVRCHPNPARNTAPARSQRATAPPADAAGWSVPTAPEYTGPLAVNEHLAGAERLEEGTLAQPEDVVFDAAGNLYTGTSDGRIWRAEVAAAGVGPFAPFAETGGHPLGMDFDPCGTRIEFADELAVATDGTVYFSDASTKYEQAFPDDFLEGRPWGRLLAYEPETGAVRVILPGLYFANGVVVAPDESWVMVAETMRGRITRHWLQGARTGETEAFAENLPVTPDNISLDAAGRVWATGQRRTPTLDAVSASAEIRTAILTGAAPAPTLPPDPHVLVVVLGADGDIVQSLHTQRGAQPPLSSAVPHEGFLYLGTNEGTGLSRVALP